MLQLRLLLLAKNSEFASEGKEKSIGNADFRQSYTSFMPGFQTISINGRGRGNVPNGALIKEL